MKVIKRLVALLLVISFLPLTLTSCVLEEFIPDFLLPEESDSYSEVRDTVTVSVLDGANYTVTSKNPIRVTKGADAKFNIDLDFGYSYVSSIEGATYENGVLTIPSVTKPTTVKMTLKVGDVVITPGHNWALGITNNATHHWYECNDKACSDKLCYEVHAGGLATYYEKAVCDVCGVEYGETVPIPEFETVTVEATAPAEGYKFLCWTVDVPLTEGGEIVSDKSEGTFEIPFESKIVENYVDTGHHVVMYRCNGGKTTEGKDYYYHTFSNKYYQMPNSIHQNGTFVRDGYSLVRYTENPDGSGEYVTLGGKLEVGDTGLAELYLVWERHTVNGLEYAIKTDDDGRQYASVIDYNGASPTVTIPDVYKPYGSKKEYPVEHISAYAFSNVAVEYVSIPKSVTVIEDNAFINCENFKTLTVHDSLISVTDAAFSDCPISRIYLNSSRGPSTAGNPGMTVLKYERLRMAAKRGEKKILVISGSSSLHGLLAEEMEAAFGGEYRVINYGTNASANAFIYLYAFTKFFSEGDIIVHAPETMSGAQLGDATITPYTIRYAECNLDIFSYVDMTHIKGFFDAIAKFNVEVRIKDGKPLREYKYDAGTDTLNEYCDLIRNPQADNYKTKDPGKNDIYKLSRITEERTSNMNLINSMIVERGATMYYSFAPYCKAAIHENSLTADAREAYVLKLQSMIDYKIISDPFNYEFDEYLFNDSDYHPGRPGASMRTAQLVADLKAALEEENE